MKRNYTISGLSDVKNFENRDTVQVTLNSRFFPAKRKTVENLKLLRDKGVSNPIILHYDFVYIVSRFAMFKESVQDAILNEICSILNYAEYDKSILGIVMHTDWPVQKALFQQEFKLQYIADNYSGSLWDTVKIQNMLEADGFATLFEESIISFAHKLLDKYNKSLPIKIYLENTTKIGPNREGSLTSILDILIIHHGLADVYGVCYDTEHHYAVTGEWIGVEGLKEIKSHFDLLVHVNTIPSEVEACSCKDRHSETTIFECSKNTPQFYDVYTEALDSLNINWVREVHEDTANREIEQWNRHK